MFIAGELPWEVCSARSEMFMFAVNRAPTERNRFNVSEAINMCSSGASKVSGCVRFVTLKPVLSEDRSTTATTDHSCTASGA